MDKLEHGSPKHFLARVTEGGFPSRIHLFEVAIRGDDTSQIRYKVEESFKVALRSGRKRVYSLRFGGVEADTVVADRLTKIIDVRGCDALTRRICPSEGKTRYLIDRFGGWSLCPLRTGGDTRPIFRIQRAAGASAKRPGACRSSFSTCLRPVMSSIVTTIRRISPLGLLIDATVCSAVKGFPVFLGRPTLPAKAHETKLPVE